MIRIHYFPNGSPDSFEEFEEGNHWGTIQDGTIIATDDTLGPDDRSFEDFVTSLDDSLLSGVIDPVAVVQELQYGRIRGVVPSATEPGTLHGGDAVRNIKHDGQLSPVEAYEMSKYEYHDGPGHDAELFKEFELADEYEQLVINHRSQDDVDELTELGRINIEDRSLLSVEDGHETVFRQMVEYLKSEAPTLNPVHVLQLNSQTRVAGVVDPETGKLVTSAADIKRDPDAIAAEISNGS